MGYYKVAPETHSSRVRANAWRRWSVHCGNEQWMKIRLALHKAGPCKIHGSFCKGHYKNEHRPCPYCGNNMKGRCFNCTHISKMSDCHTQIR